MREIAERSFAYRDVVERIARLERERDGAEQHIQRKLSEAGCPLSSEIARGLERLASVRTRLLGGMPQTRAEVLMNWLDDVIVPGRVVSTGRGGRRLVFVTERRGANFAGVREDGRRATLPLERAGRVYTDVYPLTESGREAAFADVSTGRVAPLDEPRLRDARAPANESIALINDLIDRLIPRGNETERARCEEALWSVMKEAEAVEQAERRIETLRAEVWQPFERRAHVLDHFGYLDFAAEQVTERGRWLANLRLDRPLLVGEAIERGLFASLDAARVAGLMAALAADAERDYGELALDDELVTALAKFEQIGYDIASVEWKYDLEPGPEINFSAAAAAVRWAQGAKWTDLVRETRAEEGDLFRMLSRTGESLLQISGLKEAHAAAANNAERAAASILREPVRSDEIL